jgi:hypothetical protein
MARQYRAAPGRRRRGGAGARTARRRWRSPPTARRAIARPIPSRAASRRWPRPGAISPRSAPAARDHRQSQFRQSGAARDHGPVRRLPEGIAEACRALDFPVVSGNVSLYNETNGAAILPTPSIGGVGLLDDFTKSATLAFKAAGEAILLIGETHGWLGQSVYLRDLRPRRGRAAAGRSAGRKAQRRRGARHDPRRHRDRGA